MLCPLHRTFAAKRHRALAFILVSVLFCGFSGMGLAQTLTLIAGRHEVVQRAANVRIPIQVQGNAVWSEFSGIIAVLPASASGDTNAGPRLQGIGLDQTLWSTAPGGAEFFASIPSGGILSDPSIVLKQAGATVRAPGTLLHLNLDLSQATPGDYRLLFAGTALGDSVFALRGEPIPSGFEEGRITVLPFLEPELRLRISTTGEQIALSFESVQGFTYQLEERAALGVGAWQARQQVVGLGGAQRILTPAPSPSRLTFFRIRRLPPP